MKKIILLFLIILSSCSKRYYVLEEELFLLNQQLTDTLNTTLEEISEEENTSEEETEEETSTEESSEESESETSEEEESSEEETEENTTEEETTDNTSEEETNEDTSSEETNTQSNYVEPCTTKITSDCYLSNGLSCDQETIDTSWTNWERSEPNYENEIYIFIDGRGLWYDHHKSIENNGYGLYEWRGLTEDIGEGYTFLGQYKGHSYFKTTRQGNADDFTPIYDEDGNVKAQLVIFNDLEENNVVECFISDEIWINLWISAENPSGNTLVWKEY